MSDEHTTCKSLAEKLLLFRDGELNEADTEHLRQHIHLCPMCLDLLQSYDEVIELMARLKPVQTPPGLLNRLKDGLADTRSE